MRSMDCDSRLSASPHGFAMCLLAVALVFPLLAQAQPERTMVEVFGAAGEPLTEGSVVFCPLDDECLEFPLTPAGTIALDRTRLRPGKVYTIIVYSSIRAVRYAAFAWAYDPAAFVPPATGETLAPQLRGTADEAVRFEFVSGARSTPLPVPAQPPLASPAPGWEPPATPRLVVGVLVPFMLGGNFGTDSDALGGVDDVAPGFGAFLAYRFGYPARSSTATTFREISLGYAFNRYTVGQLDHPGATSDLTFHRAALAFGLGRVSTRLLLSGALAVGYGGIYDGSEQLEIGDRTYGMFGVGFQGRLGYRLLGGATHGLTLLGQLDLMTYPADTGDDDHWYGFAPSLGAGVVVH